LRKSQAGIRLDKENKDRLMQRLAWIIKRLRKKRALSLLELSRSSGLSLSYLRVLEDKEKGKNPSFSAFRKIAKGLGESTEGLLEKMGL
jgi:transcriptional regulator with XRE-family HTH domain